MYPTRHVGRFHRRLLPLLGLVVIGPASLALSGCGIAGTTTTNLIVDFTDAQASAARDTVRHQCGSLPGVGIVPARSRDVSVYFDIQHATNSQVVALSTCVSDLRAKDPTLGIRDYRISGGAGS